MDFMCKEERVSCFTGAEMRHAESNKIEEAFA